MATRGRTSVDLSAQTRELERLRQDFESLANELEGLGPIESIAEHARGQIIKRTQEGREIGGSPFRGYSDDWREKRERAGLPGAPVNLTVSGAMLDAIDWDAKSPTLAEIFVLPSDGGGNSTSRDIVAEAHQAGSRPWFGLGNQEVKELESEWVAITLSAMLRRIDDARPVGTEISQLNDRLELVTEPRGPLANYSELRG